MKLVRLPSSLLPGCSFRASRQSGAGFSLVETVVGLTILSLFLALAYGALLVSNRRATVHRLYTLAEELARDQIDRIAAASPYNPQFPPPLGPQIPAVLALDSTRGNLPLLQTVPLYRDPTTNQVVVNATVSTSVENTGTHNTRAARVIVAFTYAGRPYQVRLNTFRTSDS